MTAHHPPMARRSTALLSSIAAIGLLAAACTAAAGSPSASPAASPSPSPSPAASASPTGKPSPSPKIGQTETGWGRIWDAVPASFPVPAGGSPVQPDIAASAAWSIASGNAAAITAALKAGLEAAGYSTAGVDGPLEDGSRIIDSVGKPADCHVQTRVRPLGTTVNVTVLFGAACPFR